MQAVLVVFSGSPPLLAITMSGIRAGTATPGSGGQGSYSNLQNAGAASAALTAAMAQGNLKKANDIITAMRQVQAEARNAATGKLPNGLSIPNGLKPGGLEVYNPSGQVTASGNVPITWSGVSSLAEIRAAASDSAAATVNVTQGQQSAYLYWNKFNVGPQTTLNFHLAENLKANPGQNIAFNKVMSPSSASHIFGKIKADGQVYILNQNGILFHNGSAVNTRSLVASTLPINENLAGSATKAGRGIANNPDYQFLFSALEVPAGKNGPTEKFTPQVFNSGKVGNVVVERGATITSPKDDNNSGGLVALVGPGVSNEGTISTANGQTILAAGLQVGLFPHASSDPSLRGLDVYIGKVDDKSISTEDLSGGKGAGTAVNSGVIDVPQGSVTMAGKTILQKGAIDGTTSVSLNGRVDLLANYDSEINTAYLPNNSQGPPVFFTKTGLVESGPGSVIRILPEWGSAEKVIGDTLALNSAVSILGQNVRFGQGALLLAPGAVKTSGALSQFSSLDGSRSFLSDGVTVDAGNWVKTSATTVRLVHDGGQIFLDENSVIDVAGSTGVEVSSSVNFITLQLRGSELASSPLQRESVIRGKNITIDIRRNGTYEGRYWAGTPLGDATGYVGLIEKTVGPLTIAGGSVSLTAGDSVVMRNGSQVNVSGGWMRYMGGSFSTSKLTTSRGEIIDISQATPDLIYSGIIKDSPKFYDPAYYRGGDGGTLAIQSAAMALDGRAQGATVVGFRQLSPLSSMESTLPAASSLSLAIFSEKFLSDLNAVVRQSLYQPVIRIAAAPDYAAPRPEFLSSLPTERTSGITLDRGLFGESGFGELSVDNKNGSFLLDRGVSMYLGGGGRLDVSAGTIDIGGGIYAPGGLMKLKSSSLTYADLLLLDSTTLLDGPVTDLWTLKQTGETVMEVGRTPDGMILLQGQAPVTQDQLTARNTGRIILGESAVLDTSGLLTDFYLSRGSAPVIMNGGGVMLNAYRTDLRPGSVINVSGGASLLPGKTSYGKAGSISISGGYDPDKDSVFSTGELRFNGALKGFSGIGQSGGSLSLAGRAFQIGGIAPTGVIGLSPSFFNQGGFSSFTIQGQGLPTASPDNWIPAVAVAPGTILSPKPISLILSSSGGRRTLVPFSMPASLAPNVSLTFRGAPVREVKTQRAMDNGNDMVVRSDIMIGKDAMLEAKPMLVSSSLEHEAGSIVLDAQTVSLEGTLSAPGGSIVISASKNTDRYARTSLDNYADAQFTLILGDRSSISASGIPLLTPDPLGIRGTVGVVLPGGEVELSGNILALPGSSISASGASADLRYFPNQLGASKGGVRTIRVDSAGGSISLHGGQMLYSAAMLNAKSGGSSANGGKLQIDSSFYFRDRIDEGSGGTAGFDRYSVRIQGSEADLFSSIDQLGVSKVASNPRKKVTDGGAYLSLAAIQLGGFDRVALDGNVAFEGLGVVDATLRIPGILKVASGGLLRSDGGITLEADSVSLGQPLSVPLIGIDRANTTIISTSYGLTADQYIALTAGPGSVTVKADQIDIGNLSLQNASKLRLLAQNGSVRGDGTLDLAGDLLIEAGAVYPASGTTFQIFAYDSGVGGSPGSIKISQTGGVSVSPLSAAGSLALYASSIDQGGTLLAPFGKITLGWDGAGAMPKDPLSGAGFSLRAQAVPETDSIRLRAVSVTSVAGRDPVSGREWIIPYGTSADGGSWIAPGGIDITSSGLPGKSVSLASRGSIVMDSGSMIDLRGGGQATAYQWIPGIGGKNNLLSEASPSYVSGSSYLPGEIVRYEGRLWSANVRIDPKKNAPSPSEGIYWTRIPERYAIIPGYSGSPDPTGYGGLPETGQMIRLSSGIPGLSAGDYTLLPASYASQPGAYLLSVPESLPSSPTPMSMPDGTFLNYGVRFDAYGSSSSIAQLGNYFTVTPPAALSKRVEFKNLSAGEFFNNQGASDPAHAADLTLVAARSMDLRSNIRSSGRTEGLDARIGISSPLDFRIVASSSGRTPGSGEILLDAGVLNSWNAGGLLIGGVRSNPDNEGPVKLSVTSASVIMEDADLMVQDLIFAATGKVELESGASIVSTATTSPLNDQSLFLSGNGALLRVSGDPEISISRGRVGSIADPASLLIGNNSSLRGGSILLDSSSLMNLADTATFTAGSVSMAAGSVAIVGRASDPIPRDQSDDVSLIIGGRLLDSLEKATALAITSYSTLSLYGSDSIAGDSLRTLKLNASAIRGFLPEDGIFGFRAETILLGNSAGEAASKTAMDLPSGSLSGWSGFKVLEFEASQFVLGKNNLRLDNFTQVNITAAKGIQLSASGGLDAGTASNLYHPSEGENADIITLVSGVTPSDLVVKDRDGATLSGDVLLDLPAGSSVLIPQLTQLSISTPFVSGASGVSSGIRASGGLVFDGSGYSATPSDSGLGVALALQGSSVEILNTRFDLTAGSLSATARSGDILVGSGAFISVRGGDIKVQDTRVTTDAGKVSLASSLGKIEIAAGSAIDLSAPSGKSLGTFSLSAPGLGDSDNEILPGGVAIMPGAKFITGGTGGASLNLDLGSLESFSSLRFGLNREGNPASFSEAGFTGRVTVRVCGGDVVLDDLVQARQFSLSADRGSITVAPYAGVNASGQTGGTISIVASGSLSLEPGAFLSVQGEKYDTSGKGGSILLSAGAAVDGQIDQSAMLGLTLGSEIDLGVDQISNGVDQFGGTLHLRAPVIESVDGLGIQISMLDSAIVGASSVAVEGYRLYELGGTVADLNSAKPLKVDGGDYDGDQTVLELAKQDALRFGSQMDAILERLIPEETPNTELWKPFTGIPILNLTAGIEIINREGSIKLSSDWDLADGVALGVPQYRYGSRKAPGFLTLRAASDLVLEATLSDGFTANPVPKESGARSGSDNMAILLDRNPDLPLNFQSWSYDLTAGADLASASTVMTSPQQGRGDVKLGKVTSKSNILPVGNSTTGLGSFGADNLTTSALSAEEGNYQVIRTGSGNITVNAAGDVRFLNQFASIYTAGTKLDDQSLGGRFDLPNVKSLTAGTIPEDALGKPQESLQYMAQFSASGGNVSLQAGRNIAQLQKRLFYTDSGKKVSPLQPYEYDEELTADSSWQLPTSWLMRRGGSSKGQWNSREGFFLKADGSYSEDIQSEIMSTAWWVNFANYLGGIATLGGGNVSVEAGGTVANVAISLPTQMRATSRKMIGRDGNEMLVEALSSESVVYQTGGGNLILRTGKNLDAGSIYLERGDASIRVNGDVVSNETRNVWSELLYFLSNPTASRTPYASSPSRYWAPTAFFQGVGAIDLQAGGRIDSLGMPGSVFSLPQGYSNDMEYRNYFTTFDAAISQVASPSFRVTALGGDITLTTKIDGLPTYQAMARAASLGKKESSPYAGAYQPWIRVVESSPGTPELGGLMGLTSPKLEIIAPAGDVNFAGDLTLYPAAYGNLIVAAGGNVVGLSRQGDPNGSTATDWTFATINLSDADASKLPTQLAPVGQAAEGGAYTSTRAEYLLSALLGLVESGSYSGQNSSQSLQLARHAKDLHRGDSSPLVISSGQDVSGIQLFSPKLTRVTSHGDIRDVSFYLQHNSADDISVVRASGNIIPYDVTTESQQKARATINDEKPKARIVQSGDIQIAGPGALMLLAGGNIDLGTAPDRAWSTDPYDSTIWNGITSIGNARNPSLPFEGADITVTAGATLAAESASGGTSGFLEFARTLLNGPRGQEYLVDLAKSFRYSGSRISDFFTYSKDGVEEIRITKDDVLTSTGLFNEEERLELNLNLLFLAIKNSAKDYYDETSPNYKTYREGKDAITKFFASTGPGDVLTRTRDIRTKNGGNISILAPGGGVTLDSVDPYSKDPPFGIITAYGGGINILAKESVGIGIGRIFTLRGGDITIWSDVSIAAGASAKTVASAPPTRVLIDPQSASVLSDLASLSTGGGIGTLQVIKGVPIADVTLVAPLVDAGDAGIRSSGNLLVAAEKILNADNIMVAGLSVGVPPPAVAASA
ncbi:MAG: filamentous hemagglutinin family protein, partial [Chthoniobacterales bacterium]|nr:filamentous hemagglutinin family protein [Chthoniobacterales bacterium]